MTHVKNFILNHHFRPLIRLLDVLMCLAVVGNMGAMIITPMLVVKNEPDILIYEANPQARAKNPSFAEPPTKEAKKIMTGKLLGIVFHWITLGVSLGVYIFHRQRLRHRRQLFAITLAATIYWSVLFSDFCLNVGFLIGRLIYA